MSKENIMDWSKQAWDELKAMEKKSHVASRAERERISRMMAEREIQLIAKNFPTCCSYWTGIYFQKLVQKLVRRINISNKHYSHPVKFCPECGKRLP